MSGTADRLRAPRQKIRREQKEFKWTDPFDGLVHVLIHTPGRSPHPRIKESLDRLQEQQVEHSFHGRRPKAMVRARLLDDSEADIDLGPLMTTAGWVGDHRRDERTWWVFDDGSSFVLTRDDHWIEFGIDWSSLRQSFDENNLPQGPGEARELAPGDAAGKLTRHGYELPDRLKGIVLPVKTEERKARRPAVRLQGQADQPIVKGKIKPRLTGARYAVVKALLDAGDKGLTGDDLVTKSGRGGAVNTLKSLANADPDWGDVILLAERPGVGYRILGEWDGD